MPEDMDNLDLPDRSSVKDTYDQALSDLKKAEELMTTFKSTAYASKYAAQALLAKVYMYMSGTFENPDKEYAQLSYDYANTVIEVVSSLCWTVLTLCVIMSSLRMPLHRQRLFSP